MTILITGGAGYIGSHMAWRLSDAGIPTLVLDDFSTGLRRLVPEGLTVLEGDIGDSALLERILTTYDVDTVLHLAGSIVVSDSVTQPLAYYENNTSKSRTLIEACVRHGVRQFVFSSTAVVYDVSAPMPLREDSPLRPISPYGKSKLMTEWMLRDAAAVHDLRFVVLRYFNVAGADPQGRSGQPGEQATHLIKAACQVALGQRDKLTIFGTDYPTADGTCIRDYVHVTDLVEAHLLALDHLRGNGASCAYNCGYGRGVSVREVIAAVERITRKPLPVEAGPRRPGDPPELVADAMRLRHEQGWQPRHDDLEFIIQTALDWERRLLEHRHTGSGERPANALRFG